MGRSAPHSRDAIMRRTLIVGLFVLTTFFAGNLIGVGGGLGERAEVEHYVRPHGRLERVLATGDGQMFAELAAHPEIRVEQFRLGPPGAAYRASRPIWYLAAWVLTLGHASAVPAMLLAMTFAAGVGLLWAAQRSLRRPEGALALLFAPGLLTAFSWLTPEPLGLMLTLFGLSTGGVGWFIAAGLTRESFLVIPCVIFLRTRNPRYLLPGAAWTLWVASVWLRIGSLPGNIPGGAFSAPFQGIAKVVHGWGGGEWVAFAALIASGVIAARRFPHFVAGYASFASIMGGGVWLTWTGFTRPLVTLHALALLALLGKHLGGEFGVESRSNQDGRSVPDSEVSMA